MMLFTTQGVNWALQGHEHIIYMLLFQNRVSFV